MKKARKSKTILANLVFLIAFVISMLKGEGYIGDPDPAFVSMVKTVAAALLPLLNIWLRYVTHEAIK